MIIFDSEIKKMILGRNERLIEGLQYCQGWSDYKGMGIAVVCVYELEADTMHTLRPEDDPADKEKMLMLISQHDYVVGFNNHGFDNKLLAANGIRVPPEKSYDIYEQVIEAAGLSNAPYWERKGYKLDDLTRANNLPRKNDDGGGALAPQLFQQGEWDRLVAYCQNDVMMTAGVINRILAQMLACPRTGHTLPVKKPADLLGTTQVGLF